MKVICTVGEIIDSGNSDKFLERNGLGHMPRPRSYEVILDEDEAREYGFLKEVSTEDQMPIDGINWDRSSREFAAFFGKDRTRVVYRDKFPEGSVTPFECWQEVPSAGWYNKVGSYRKMTDQEVLCWVEDGVLP